MGSFEDLAQLPERTERERAGQLGHFALQRSAYPWVTLLRPLVRYDPSRSY